MNGHSIQQKLFKVGEFGFGKPVIAIKSGHRYLHEKNLRFQNIDPVIKTILFHLDLSIDDSIRSKNFAHTLNEYSFVETVILDFPAFIELVHNHSRIKLAHDGIKNLIVVNPVDYEKGLIKKLLGQEYIGLNGENFKLSSNEMEKFSATILNAHLIHSEKIDIISLQDKKTSLKIASMMKNSKLHNAKNIEDVFDLIKKCINDG